MNGFDGQNGSFARSSRTKEAEAKEYEDLFSVSDVEPTSIDTTGKLPLLTEGKDRRQELGAPKTTEGILIARYQFNRNEFPDEACLHYCFCFHLLDLALRLGSSTLRPGPQAWLSGPRAW